MDDYQLVSDKEMAEMLLIERTNLRAEVEALKAEVRQLQPYKDAYHRIMANMTEILDSVKGCDHHSKGAKPE